MCVWRNVEACLCSHCCSGKAIIITYSDGVLLALGIQHSKGMSSIVCLSLQLFSTLSHKRHEFRKKKILNIKCVGLIFTTTFAWNITRAKNSARYIINVHRCSCKGKGKSVPLQAWSGPEGSRKLRFPDYMTMAQDGGKVVTPTHRPPLPPRKCSWYSFMLEAESTPGP